MQSSDDGGGDGRQAALAGRHGGWRREQDRSTLCMRIMRSIVISASMT